MVRTIPLICLILLGVTAGAQTRDSAYYQRVEERVAATVTYFAQHVTQEASLVDTFTYAQRILANHLESNAIKTTRLKTLQSMNAYAFALHEDRLRKVLPRPVLERYLQSFETEATGFSFCRTCGTKKRSAEKFCGKCGTAY